MSSPDASWRPPDTSETAITVAPSACKLRGGDTADVSEALDDAALAGERPPSRVARSRDHHHDACAGRLVAEDASRRSRSACR